MSKAIANPVLVSPSIAEDTNANKDGTNIETPSNSNKSVVEKSKGGNIYEVFREAIVATVYATVVKVRDTSTSYTWALGKVYSACADSCKLPVSNTPTDFKRIVKFEFEKLRERIEKSNGYEHQRSKEDYIFADGQVKARLVNTYHKIVELSIQIQEARKQYSRLGNRLTDDSLSMEKRNTIRKQMQKRLVVIDHCEAELKRQQEVQAEAAKQVAQT